MAYDKIIPIRQRMDNCLGYVLNEEKNSLDHALTYAENPDKAHQLVTGINCQAATAYSEMQATKRRWDKTGGILGYHIIHSYAPGEVTPEEAHAAGVEFARRLLGDSYEAVISTHLDREHLHCHIVFNSVSFVDGRKYRSDFQSYFGTLRETSNAVSRDHGLSVIEETTGQGKHYAEWEAERTGKETVRGLIRRDIDAAIRESFTFESFLIALRRQGYSIKYGPNVKHTAICPPGGQRFFRLSGMGERYTEAAIRERLVAIRRGDREDLPVQIIEPPKRYTIRRGYLTQMPRKKVRGFRALYVSYLYLLNIRRPKRNVSLPDGYARLQATMRSRNVMATIILQNISQLKELFKDSWEGIIGNADAFVYLGGNEQSTHKYVSELLGKETIETRTSSQSRGRNGSYSQNFQQAGRELLTPDEVRMLDNRYALVLLRGEAPVIDEKYDLMRHPNIKLTADGGAAPYIHSPRCLYAEEDLDFIFTSLDDIEIIDEMEES